MIYIDNTYIKSTALIFKNDLNFFKSTLLEISAIDSLNFKKYCKEFEIFFKNSRILIYYIFYFYKLKLKISLICNYKNKIESIDLIYKNSNWLERETSEMYNVYFFNKRDSRKLLLDYTSDINPMLKDFPTEGDTECYFNTFERQVVIENYIAVEL